MKKQIKLLWLEALRSGRYKQTSKALRIGNSFCCLGVLCDLADAKGWSPTPDSCGNTPFKDQEFPLRSGVAAPPRAVGEWAGFSADPVRPGTLDTNPTIAFPSDHPVWQDQRLHKYIERHGFASVELSLAALNDHGFSFLEIADIIEQFVPETE